MPCEVNSNADSEFDLRAGGFYTRLVFTLTNYRPVGEKFCCRIKSEEHPVLLQKQMFFFANYSTNFWRAYGIWHLKMAKNTSFLHHNRAQIGEFVSPIQTVERSIPHFTRGVIPL